MQDFDIQCWSGNHLLWILAIVLPGIIFWLLLLPGLLFRVLWKNREKLEESAILSKYSFIYAGYQKNRFYWEFVILARKVLLITATVFGTPGEQAFYVIIIIQLAFYMQDNLKPFLDPKWNKLELLSISDALAVGLASVYFYYVNSRFSVDVIILLLVLVATVSYFGLWAKLYFKTYLKQLQEHPKVN